MANIHVGIDRIDSASYDNNVLSQFCEKLRNAGHQVTSVGRNPSAIQSHMRSNSCDIMMQIAGGMCPGSLADFSWGTRPGGYYHASKFCIPIYTGTWHHYDKYDPKKYVLTKRAWDDNFSGSLDLSKVLNKTWQVAANNIDRSIGFVEGKTVDELASNTIKCLGGKGTSTGDGSGTGGGSSVLDLIKQVCSDWDAYGVELGLTGDKLTVKRTQPSTAVPMTNADVQMNTVSYTDYDSNTPNSWGGVKDEVLVKRFGEIPLELEIEDAQKADILRVNQRGHNHSIDLKCVLNPKFKAGRWVKLTLPELGIDKRNYYISKCDYQEERLMGLTLECAPPSIYVDVPEETEEEETTTDETTEEEDT